MSKQASINYLHRIDSVCRYINEHLDDALTLDNLSSVACFSKYHFHRVFAELMGISVSQYIVVMRLKRASYQLVYQTEQRIIDIAFQAGYENPESFSRAFKQKFLQSPSQFRREPQWQTWHSKMQFAPSVKRILKMKVDIVDFKKTMIAVKEHRGAPNLLNHSVSTFIEWRKGSQLSPVEKSKTFGLVYDDPATTNPSQFRFDICGEVVQRVPLNDFGIINKVIPEGRCAKVRHVGSHDTMDDKVRALYGEWLSESGERLRDFPCFFHYLNLFPQVDEHQLITDIYLPIE